MTGKVPSPFFLYNKKYKRIIIVYGEMIRFIFEFYTNIPGIRSCQRSHTFPCFIIIYQIFKGFFNDIQNKLFFQYK